MQYTAKLHESFNRLSKLVNDRAAQYDGRIIGSIYTAAQDFVVAAENAGLTQDTSLEVKSPTLKLATLRDGVNKIETILSLKVNAAEDLKLHTQDLIDYMHKMGVSASDAPKTGGTPEIAPQKRVPWGPK